MVETEEIASSPRPAAERTTPLVDRCLVLDEFATIFSGAAAPASAWLSIEGGWGMGRSALLDATCRLAQEAGGIVLRTRGDRAVPSAPFRTIRHLLDDIASLHNVNDELIEQRGTVLNHLERDAERYIEELGGAFHRLLGSVSALGFVVVAVDDAHQVDDATMRCLENVFHRLDGEPIWILTTSPPRTLGTMPIMIDQILVHQKVRHFELTALSRDGVRQVLSTELRADPEDAFVDAVFEATSGRPSFVVELARSCRDERLAPDDEAARQLDRLFIPRIAEGVLGRLHRLSSAARALLESCAVFGDLSDVVRLLRLADLDPDAAERAVDVLRQYEFLAPGVTLAFVAPVVQWAVLRVIPSPRRSRLHARSADLLEFAGADEFEVVSHLLATEPSWSDEVTEKLRVAGNRFMAQGHVRVAAQCLRHSMNDVTIREAVS